MPYLLLLTLASFLLCSWLQFGTFTPDLLCHLFLNPRSALYMVYCARLSGDMLTALLYLYVREMQ